MFNHLWELLIPHITIIGLSFDVVGILIIFLENFFPKLASKVDRWLSELSYVSFTRRLEAPLIFSYNAFYQYLFIPTFLYFLVAVFYDYEMVEGIINDKRDFINIIIYFLMYFTGYIMVALLTVWLILPLLFIFCSKVIYKEKPLSGTGFMLIILGILITIPNMV